MRREGARCCEPLAVCNNRSARGVKTGSRYSSVRLGMAREWKGASGVGMDVLLLEYNW